MVHHKVREITCLPPNLLHELKSHEFADLSSSLIFHPEIATFRYQCLCVTSPSPPESPALQTQPLLLDDGDDTQCEGAEHEPHDKDTGGSSHIFTDAIPRGFLTKSERNLLHDAAYSGDVPLTYEGIRLGMNVNARNCDGKIPLLMACQRLCTHTQAALFSGADGEISPPASTLADHRRRAWCCAQIATVLISQHADMNARDVLGFTPLAAVCLSGTPYWDLIELLLQHGADVHLHGPPFDLSSQFDDPAEQAVFADLVRTYTPNKTRPLRVCPCWSGRSLPECHGSRIQSYPLYFLCPCGSEERYESCCRRKGICFQEFWLEPTHEIIIAPVVPAPLLTIDEALDETFDRFRHFLLLRRREGGLPDTRAIDAAVHRHELAILNKLSADERVDPAFLVALMFTSFFPLCVLVPSSHSNVHSY